MLPRFLHSSVHFSPAQQTFIKHLLCTRHCFFQVLGAQHGNTPVKACRRRVSIQHFTVFHQCGPVVKGSSLPVQGCGFDSLGRELSSHVLCHGAVRRWRGRVLNKIVREDFMGAGIWSEIWAGWQWDPGERVWKAGPATTLKGMPSDWRSRRTNQKLRAGGGGDDDYQLPHWGLSGFWEDKFYLNVHREPLNGLSRGMMTGY